MDVILSLAAATVLFIYFINALKSNTKEKSTSEYGLIVSQMD